MPRLEIPLYATFAMCAGPVLFYRGLRDLRTRRLIRNTPTARIRSMAMGLVEVHGVVLERSRIRAPFTGHECAYWEVDVAVRARRGWSVIHRACSGNPFFLDDGTGIALVYPTGSRCSIPSSAEEECSGFELPEMYAEYLKRAGVWQRYFGGFSAMRFRERTLEEGAEIFVLGSAEPRTPSLTVSDPDLDGAEIETVAPRATGTDGPLVDATAAAPPNPPATLAHARALLASSAATPMQVAAIAAMAAPGAGTFAAATAALARRHHGAPGPTRLRALHRQVAAVISRGRNEPTFLISAGSETAVEAALTLSMFLKLAGGPLLTVFGLGYWLLTLSNGPARP